MRRFLSVMASSTGLKPRRFAPLREGAGNSSNAPRLQGVVFDVDGTLCQPQNYMFAQMRAALGIPKSVDILEHIYSLPTPEAQTTAMEAVRAIEREAMTRQVAQPGLAELMSYLDARGLRKGICTRNFEQPVAHLLTRFLEGVLFEPVVTRDFRPPKPDPAGILHIALSWGLTRGARAGEAGIPAAEDREVDGNQLLPTEAGEEVADASGLLMVGDSIDDMTAGRRAGAATVLLVNDINRHLAEHEHTDLVISRLDELIDVLEHGFEGREF
ncbi:HAD-like domain-containing protein [Phialemonium atrogriseum]|uniref:HAD-like domain-containing protein n=1 Tax=Phialemonium atrogriseum TaxID=1093897 RepID=A0AAJ0C6L2_9PEZI|nr:HAD-like domain-containing protein [Phialemonium atrogriseum]KAK1771113.1 HAD-like domain-containing protein [Phialemonium atrogriseum]